MSNNIFVQGARVHNLKNIDVNIPRNKFVVITGISGSGKSSLAFDTIYAEGQRRYIETLSTYSRYFMDKLKPPDVDSIFGLSPVVAIDQKTITTNPRSTVGTVTEVYDYLRLLMAKLGVPKCPIHNELLQESSIKEIITDIMKLEKNLLFKIFSPAIRNQKGEMTALLRKYKEMGFLKAKIDGNLKALSKVYKLSKKQTHNVEVLIDQLYVNDKYLPRLEKSLQLAVELSGGFIQIELSNGKKKNYSTQQCCPVCLYSFPELDPKLFSFNSPKGACPYCKGLGYVGIEIEEDFDSLASHIELSRMAVKEIEEMEFYDFQTCESCQGKRLRKEALSVWIKNKNIFDLASMDLDQLEDFFKKTSFPKKYSIISKKIVQKILEDIDILKRVGVSYLSLNRGTKSLSGGEAQRIRLASQISSSLIGVLYVLDEPSIGLHPIDHEALLKLIEKIKKRRNTILIVEHDENTIRKADYIIDIGPRAGSLGGELVYQGSVSSILKNKNSLTADYLSRRKIIPVPETRRTSKKYIKLQGAKGNNLKNVNLKIPLGTFIGITGVSGSGKSSLIIDTLYKAISSKIYKNFLKPLDYKKLIGDEEIDKITMVDQKPIGRTSRSIPATYVGVMSLIRNFMSELPAAKVRGYRAGHFSFNVKGGRCDYCDGAGSIKQEMNFLSHAIIPCGVCVGKRYSPELLDIRYKDKNISDILNMTIRQAAIFFENHPRIHSLLKSLESVGLSYLTLGQSSSTLSGGEAQRIKLTKELSKRNTGKCIYILDEPTTGLHFDDIQKLLQVLNKLVDKGSTVIVIEHNLDVIKCSDHVIDLGPKGGVKGGYILATGTPEEVAKNKKSMTGSYIKQALSIIARSHNKKK